MEVSVSLNNGEFKQVERFAQKEGLSVSEVVRKVVLERVEDEGDSEVYEEVLLAFRRNPFSFSLKEVEIELGRI